ncbi:FAD-dependent oxidoreductase [Rhodobacter capsulatus]|uniref:FAD-dependent oxidoreductase n=1 Tax=Rhodobacter capsulatus TaxID=1061 RepID=UPI0040287074
MDVTTNGQVSFWFADIGGLPPGARPAGDLAVDVCIIGAGFTGLWSAYYLKQLAPSLSIAVLERDFAGFGASTAAGARANSAGAAGNICKAAAAPG